MVTILILVFAAFNGVALGYFMGRGSATESEETSVSGRTVREMETFIESLREMAWTYRDVDHVFASIVIDEVRSFQQGPDTPGNRTLNS